MGSSISPGGINSTFAPRARGRMKNAGEDLEVYVRIAIARSTNRVLRGKKGDFKRVL